MRTPVIELLYFDGCPNHLSTEEVLKEVLDAEGIEAPIRYVRIETPEDARVHRFPGSPTVRIDGLDIDPSDTPEDFTMRCRVYLVNGRFSGVPAREWIHRALEGYVREREFSSSCTREPLPGTDG